MAATSPRAARLGFLAAGLLLGLVLALLAVRLYVREAERERVEAAIRVRIGLPEEAFELEEVYPDRTVRAALRDVAVVDRAGDTIVAAPRLRMVFDPRSLAGEGPLEFRDVVVEAPVLRLVQERDGSWNLARAFALEAAGERVLPGGAEEVGRGFVLRGVRLVGGHALVATPWDPADSASLLSPPRPRLARLAGTTMLVRTARDVDASLPVVRFGGTRGWRVEVADLNARLTAPDVRLAALRGWAEQAGEGFRFALETLRTDASTLAGRGTVRLAGAAPAYDVEIRAAPLSFRDLRWLRPTLPAEGTARFALRVQTRPGGSTAWTVRDADVRALGSRVAGRLTAVTREGAPATFLDTRITFDPLLLSTVEQLAAREIPYAGRITGTLTSTEAIQGGEGALQLDLAGSFTPEGIAGVPASVLAAHGRVGFGAEGVRFRGLRVEAEPLHLAALAPYVQNGRERLRGVLRGSVLLTGTPADLRAESGLLAYQVGDAPETRLRISEARFTRDPALRYTLRAEAEPLALATLTELYPALPFRTAVLGGPISVSGSAESMRFAADLSGSAGGIELRGTTDFTEPLRFDVSGRLNAFRTAAVLASAPPAQGPLSGTFSARGTAADFGFGVDLTQGGGRAALQGRVRDVGGPRQFEVSGTVADFRVGALLGRPGLLPSPVSGTLSLAGGGRQPYRFDVDLRGAQGGVDLEGWYAPGAVPTYAVDGAVAGLDLEGLPGMAMLPRTSLTGTVRLNGQGTSPETLSGELEFRTTGPSTVGGLAVQTAVMELAARNGVLTVDAFDVALGGARLTATGSLGLTTREAGPLRFSLAARDLSTLAAVVPPAGPLEPAMSGSIEMNGWVRGSLRDPEIGAAVRASGLRWQEWRAGSLSGNLRASRAGTQWVGELALQGESLVFKGGESLQSLRLETNVTPTMATFGVFARRNAESDVAASGALELDGRTLRGARLEVLTLRMGATTWQLQAPSRIQWGGIEGVAVDNLVLRRSGQSTGWISLDGRLPPTGRADLRVRAAGVDLAELRRIAGRGPRVGGLLTLDAVIEGPVSEPEVSLTASVDSLRYEGGAADRVALNARYAGRRLVGGAGAWVQGRQVVTADLTLPMLFSWGGTVPAMEILDAGPLTARLVADSVPLGLVTASVPGVSGGEGALAAEVNVGGTPADPVVRGWAGISGGAIDVDTLGTRWDSIRGRVSMEGKLVRIDSLVVRSRGYLRLAGTVRLDGIRTPTLYLTTTLDEFLAVDRPDVAELALSGRMALSGRLPNAALSGRLTLDEGTIYIPEINQGQTELDIVETEIGAIGADSVPREVAASAASLMGALQVDNLQVIVEDDVWLESPDARVQIASTGEGLRIDRRGGMPQIYGELQALRGTYTLRIGEVIRREFDIERGRVEFFGTPDFNPALDIVAAHEVRTAATEGGRSSVLRILVSITGTLEQPRLALTSETRPPLPEEELFNYLVFGRPSFALGAETGMLAQQIILENFLAGYLAGELERTLAGTGLVDCVRVRTGAAGAIAGGPLGLETFGSALGLGATSLEFCTELAEGLFATVEVGGLLGNEPTLGFGLEWEIDRHWSVRAAREVPRQAARYRRDRFLEGLDYQWSTDIFWRREFGFPRVEEDSVPPAPAPGPRAPAPDGGEESPRREETGAEPARRAGSRERER